MDFVETMKLALHTQIIFLFTVVFSSSVFPAGDALIGQITRSDLENSAHKIWFNQNYESHVVDIETTKKPRHFWQMSQLLFSWGPGATIVKEKFQHYSKYWIRYHSIKINLKS